MRNSAYNVTYSEVSINSSLLTVSIYSPVRTTPVYNDIKLRDVITEFDCTVAGFTVTYMEN